MAQLTFSPAELTEALNTFIQNPSAPQFLGPQLTSRPPWVRFETDHIPPPTTLYLAPEDQMRVNLWTPTTGLVVNINIRYLDEDGRVKPQRTTLRPAGTSLREQFVIEVPECFLLSCEVNVESEAIQSGELYCVVDVFRGAAADRLSHGHLIQSEVTTFFHPCWPWSPHRGHEDHKGRLFRAVEANPVAGATIVFSVPLGRRRRIRTLRVSLTTDATVANRLMRLFINDDNGDLVTRVTANVVQPASLTLGYDFAPALTSASALAGNFVNVALPDVVLPEGWAVVVDPAFFQAGDALTNFTALVEDWPDSNV